MNRTWLPLIFAVVFFASCAGNQGKRILKFPETPGMAGTPVPYTIIDYKNMADDGNIPEWVSLYLDGGVRGIETLDAYTGRYVFVSRSEGGNFRALTHWANHFSLELDFPRLAAARIEARFSVPYPDQEYGAFYENLIRTASDAFWTGAVRDDDFWIFRKFIPSEDTTEAPAGAAIEMLDETDQEIVDLSWVDENWEFLILVTIEKSLFASQLDTVFRKIDPNPRPTRDQISAANRVKDRFFEGF